MESEIAVVVDDNWEWDGSVAKDGGNAHVSMDPGSNKAHERNHSNGAADIL